MAQYSKEKTKIYLDFTSFRNLIGFTKFFIVTLGCLTNYLIIYDHHLMHHEIY